jgi:hypothetical protein
MPRFADEVPVERFSAADAARGETPSRSSCSGRACRYLVPCEYFARRPRHRWKRNTESLWDPHLSHRQHRDVLSRYYRTLSTATRQAVASIRRCASNLNCQVRCTIPGIASPRASYVRDAEGYWSAKHSCGTLRSMMLELPRPGLTSRDARLMGSRRSCGETLCRGAPGRTARTRLQSGRAARPLP